jgi:hypothetical protein
VWIQEDQTAKVMFKNLKKQKSKKAKNYKIKEEKKLISYKS